MRVRCVRIINPIGEEVTEHASVAIGQEYIVLSLSAMANGDALVQLATGPLKKPTLWEARMFETVSNDIPTNWRAVVRPDGFIEIAPESWLRRSFWDDFFGNEGSSEEAIRRAHVDYRRELALLLEEST
jgi:hypothetical protein